MEDKCYEAYRLKLNESYIGFVLKSNRNGLKIEIKTVGIDKNLIKKLSGTKIKAYSTWNDIFKQDYEITTCSRYIFYKDEYDILKALILFYEATKDSKAWELTSILEAAHQLFELYNKSILEKELCEVSSEPYVSLFYYLFAEEGVPC